MPTDHQMVPGLIIGEGARRHRRYDKELATWPITEVKGGTRQEGDSHFMALKRRVKKTSQREITTSEPWISDTTWRMVDQRAELGRKCIANQGERRMLTRGFQAALKEGIICRVRRAGGEIEALAAKDQLR